MSTRLSRPALLIVVLAFMGCSDKGGNMLAPPTPPTDLDLELVQGGLDAPLMVTAPLNDSRLFIVERSGAIRIIKNGSMLPAAFLDIGGDLATGDSEQGLLGLAFDPLYASNGRFYVALTANNGKGQIRTYQVSGDPDVANATAATLLEWDDPAPNHNGGMLQFGPDGMLYASNGDGGVQGDPDNHAQDTAELLGKMLRLDVRTGALQIPSDNPYSSPARREIWSIGLRNPWRFSFDRSTGDLYIADVGYATREEVSVSPNSGSNARGRAANYGWRVIEGTDCYAPNTGCVTTGFTAPVLDYGRSEGCAVIGGYVYRGTAIPGLQGTYFYSDHCQHWVKSFYYSGGTISQKRTWSGLDPGDGVTSFGEDSAGELYICTENTGNVYRIVAATP